MSHEFKYANIPGDKVGRWQCIKGQMNLCFQIFCSVYTFYLQ